MWQEPKVVPPLLHFLLPLLPLCTLLSMWRWAHPNLSSLCPGAWIPHLHPPTSSPHFLVVPFLGLQPRWLVMEELTIIPKFLHLWSTTAEEAGKGALGPMSQLASRVPGCMWGMKTPRRKGICWERRDLGAGLIADWNLVCVQRNRAWVPMVRIARGFSASTNVRPEGLSSHDDDGVRRMHPLLSSATYPHASLSP